MAVISSIASKNADLMRAHIGVFDLRNIRRIDLPLVALTAALIVCGLLVLISAARPGLSETEGFFSQLRELVTQRDVLKQILAFAVGAVLALLIICTDYRFLISLAPLLYLISIGLLVLVLFIGMTVKGGQRWINLGFVNFQPSELAKVALIYMLAWYFTLIGPRIQKLPYFLLTFLIPAVPGLLILEQPNLGTTLTLGPIVFVMLFVAGCRRWHLAALVVSGLVFGLIAGPIVWNHLEDYQKKRVMSFFSPSEEDMRESGYHTMQTMITVGSGQMHGRGYLKGTQTHLSFLPEHHTDFIFAVLAEEKGFVGAIVVIGLFTVFFLRGFALARDCPDLSGTLLAVGSVTILAFHVFVNIAITLGLLPVTGIPLPFFSSGGSFCLITMILVGTMLNVHIRKGFFG